MSDVVESNDVRQSWKIFLANEPKETSPGSMNGVERLEKLPAAPPWRPFGKNAVLKPPAIAADDKNLDYLLARSFRATPEMEEAVNTALYLRRPLLVTGKPGNGKSSLIRAVARQLQLGPVLRWSITSKSTLKEGLYSYDALGRLDAQNRRTKVKSNASELDDSDIGDFIELGPLGTALLPSSWPRALLVDEIDKADLDLPNDLLNMFEEGEYSIPELARAKVRSTDGTVTVRTWRRMEQAAIRGGYVKCTHFPFIVLTSNREREFPPAFMRRCIRIAIAEPDEAMLGDIVESHFDEATRSKAAGIIKDFLKSRNEKKELANDQLLNAVYMLFGSGNTFGEPEKKALIDKLFKPISGPEASR